MIQIVRGYHFEPFFTTTGTNRVDVADSSSLRLSSFTVATWFKTTGGWSDEGIMVNKGGLGSESAGATRTMDYGLPHLTNCRQDLRLQVV